MLELWLRKMEVPWYAKSPSPFTLIVWLIFAVWLTFKIRKKVVYRKWQFLNAFTDALFVVGLVTSITDFMWVIACLIRFGRYYPFFPDVFQLLLCLGRDAVAAIFCFLLIKHLFDMKFLSFNRRFVLALMLNAIFFGIWFGIAETPALTDWTYAIRHDYSLETIVISFLLSHVIGRIILFIILYNIIKRD